MSVKNKANDAFIKEWHTFIKDPKRVTNDPMDLPIWAGSCLK